MRKINLLTSVLVLSCSAAIYANPFGGETIINAGQTGEVVTTAEEEGSVSIKEVKLKPTIDKTYLRPYVGKTGVIRAWALNVRTAPWGDISGQISKDIKVEIIGYDGDWFIINMGGGEGYIHSKWVDAEGYKRDFPDDGVVVSDVNVYDVNGDIIDELDGGEDVEILANCGSFWKIKFDEKEAFLLKTDVDADTMEEADGEVEETPEDAKDNDDSEVPEEENIEISDDSDDAEDSVEVENNDTDTDSDTDADSAANTNSDTSTDSNTSTDTNTETEKPSSTTTKEDPRKNNDNYVVFNGPTDSDVINKEIKKESTTKKIIKELIKKTSKAKISDAIKKVDNKKNTANGSYSVAGLGKLLKPAKVSIKTFLTARVGSRWDTKGQDYSHVQGFCSDGTYFYVALMTTKPCTFYTDQHTKILKIDMKSKKVVKAKRIGYIGHSNSLCYNPKTKKIYTAPCSRKMSYICEIDTGLKSYKKIYLKNKSGKKYTNKCFASFGYDPAGDQYIVKMSNRSLGYFDSKFKLKKTVKVSHLKINDSITGQALTCDGKNIFSACGNLASRPTVNYILCYDMNGKYLHKITLTKLGTKSERAELEQMTFWNGKYYTISNVSGKFRIHKINLRD